jgi:hypothetical protein
MMNERYETVKRRVRGFKGVLRHPPRKPPPLERA